MHDGTVLAGEAAAAAASSTAADGLVARYVFTINDTIYS